MAITMATARQTKILQNLAMANTSYKIKASLVQVGELRLTTIFKGEER